MYRAILVPLDGSALAERALPYAEALAQVSGAHLVLMRAAHTRAFPLGDITETQIAAMKEVEDYLEAQRQAFAERNVVVETAAPYGDPATWIVEEVPTRDIDVIVMATHGRSGLNHLTHGSVAESVLARSPVPVLLVRAWEAAQVPPATLPRILVPLDGSEFAEAALPAAHQLAAATKADVILATAVIPPVYPVLSEYGDVLRYVDQEIDAQRAIAATYLDGVADRYAAEYGAPRPRTAIEIGDPAVTMARLALDERADYLVMATHGRTGLTRALFGSVTGRVLRNGSTPLLLVSPRAPHVRQATSGKTVAEAVA